MNTEKFYDELEICIQAIQNGADPQACILLFPEHASELEPLINTSYLAYKNSNKQVSAESVQRHYKKIMTEAKSKRTKKTSSLFRRQLPKIALASVIVAIILIFGVGSLLSYSVQAIPGSQIHPLQYAMENLRQKFSGNQTARTEIHANIQRKVDEVKLLIDQGRHVDVSFSGEIDEISTDFLTIGDVLVKLAAETQMTGEIESGSLILVKGTTNPNGWIDASEIFLQAKEIIGIFQNINTSSIIVNGKKFLLKRDFQIDPRAAVGDQIIILLETDEDGIVYARAAIKVPDDFSTK